MSQSELAELEDFWHPAYLQIIPAEASGADP